MPSIILWVWDGKEISEDREALTQPSQAELERAKDREQLKVNRSKRNRKVAEELKYIPQGSVYQNMLRAGYHNMRRRELSRNPALPAKDSLLRAIESVRKHNPDFQPAYDKEFFQTRTHTEADLETGVMDKKERKKPKKEQKKGKGKPGGKA